MDSKSAKTKCSKATDRISQFGPDFGGINKVCLAVLLLNDAWCIEGTFYMTRYQVSVIAQRDLFYFHWQTCPVKVENIVKQKRH